MNVPYNSVAGRPTVISISSIILCPLVAITLKTSSQLYFEHFLWILLKFAPKEIFIKGLLVCDIFLKSKTEYPYCKKKKLNTKFKCKLRNKFRSITLNLNSLLMAVTKDNKMSGNMAGVNNCIWISRFHICVTTIKCLGLRLFKSMSTLIPLFMHTQSRSWGVMYIVFRVCLKCVCLFATWNHCGFHRNRSIQPRIGSDIFDWVFGTAPVGALQAFHLHWKSGCPFCRWGIGKDIKIHKNANFENPP